jgi:hypothetical protein
MRKQERKQDQAARDADLPDADALDEGRHCETADAAHRSLVDAATIPTGWIMPGGAMETIAHRTTPAFLPSKRAAIPQSIS